MQAGRQSTGRPNRRPRSRGSRPSSGDPAGAGSAARKPEPATRRSRALPTATRRDGRARGRTFEANTNAIRRRADPPRLGAERVEGGSGEPVVARAGRTWRTGSSGRPNPGTVPGGVGCASAGSKPIRSRSPVRSGAGPRPVRRSVERLPSVGSTSSPPRTATYVRAPPTHRPTSSTSTVRTSCDVAPVRAIVVGTSKRSTGPSSVASSAAAPGGFPTSRLPSSYATGSPRRTAARRDARAPGGRDPGRS